jgi:hypothetical protein
MSANHDATENQCVTAIETKKSLTIRCSVDCCQYSKNHRSQTSSKAFEANLNAIEQVVSAVVIDEYLPCLESMAMLYPSSRCHRVVGNNITPLSTRSWTRTQEDKTTIENGQHSDEKRRCYRCRMKLLHRILDEAISITEEVQTILEINEDIMKPKER